MKAIVICYQKFVNDISNVREERYKHSCRAEEWIKTGSQKLHSPVLLPMFKGYFMSVLPSFQNITKQDTAWENVVR